MSYDHVVLGAVLVSAVAHAWFLRHAPQVIPGPFAAMWIVVASIGVHADRAGLPPWVAAACAVVAAVAAVVGLPRLVARATRAEAGAALSDDLDREITQVRQLRERVARERAADHEILRRAGAARSSPPPAEVRS